MTRVGIFPPAVLTITANHKCPKTGKPEPDSFLRILATKELGYDATTFRISDQLFKFQSSESSGAQGNTRKEVMGTSNGEQRKAAADVTDKQLD
ncbi:hypothetical protein V8D89_002544 [Ganoderma adspersum]